MEEYIFLADILYEENKFRILSSKKYRYKYFLKILEDNSLSYPTLEEFLKLDSVLNRSELLFKASKDRRVWDNNASKLKDYILIPKVIFKGVLITLTVSFILSGCISNANLENITSASEMQTYVDTVTKETEQEIFYTSKMDDFRNYVDKKNPTWDDLREAVKQNDNITEKYKTWLNEGIGNLEKQLNDMDLVVLYFNITRMEIIESDEKEINEATGISAAGYYDVPDGKVVIIKDKEDKSTFFHEALGHPSTETEIKDKVRHSTKILDGSDLNKSIQTVIFPSSNMGKGFEEGKAETITKIAMGNYYSRLGMSYPVEVEELRMFLKAFDISLSEFLKNGTTNIANTMNQIGINNCLDYIKNVDDLCTVGQTQALEARDDILMSKNMKAFFINYYNCKINAGESKENVISHIKNVIEEDVLNNVVSIGNGFLCLDGVVFSRYADEVIQAIEEQKEVSSTQENNNERG